MNTYSSVPNCHSKLPNSSLLMDARNTGQQAVGISRRLELRTHSRQLFLVLHGSSLRLLLAFQRQGIAGADAAGATEPRRLTAKGGVRGRGGEPGSGGSGRAAGTVAPGSPGPPCPSEEDDEEEGEERSVEAAGTGPRAASAATGTGRDNLAVSEASSRSWHSAHVLHLAAMWQRRSSRLSGSMVSIIPLGIGGLENLPRTQTGTTNALWMYTQLAWGLGNCFPGWRRSGGYLLLTRSLPRKERKSSGHFDLCRACFQGGVPWVSSAQYEETVVINTWIDSRDGRWRIITGSIEIIIRRAVSALREY